MRLLPIEECDRRPERSATVRVRPAVLFRSGTLVLDLPQDRLEIARDEDHPRRACMNLPENANRQTPADRQIALSCHTFRDDAVVRVADTGERIAPEFLACVRERFYRVDASRTGQSRACGLGIAVSRSIFSA